MKVCIDPGHGNYNTGPRFDSGATADQAKEADVCLSWALTLKHVLTQNGIEVFMTRDDNTDKTPVGQRDNRAEQAGCTHFISIHCNASADSRANGTEGYYRDNKDKALAQIVYDCMTGAMNSGKRGLKPEGSSQHNRLAVFDFDGPCTLIEIGFITNQSDRDKMLKTVTRLAFADALVKRLK